MRKLLEILLEYLCNSDAADDSAVSVVVLLKVQYKHTWVLHTGLGGTGLGGTGLQQRAG